MLKKSKARILSMKSRKVFLPVEKNIPTGYVISYLLPRLHIYNSHSVASISEPKIQFVNLYVNCQLWLSFIKIVVGIFVYWKTLEMYYMLYMHQDVLATVSLSNWYSNGLVLGRDKQYQDCYWIEYRILNCPLILY